MKKKITSDDLKVNLEKISQSSNFNSTSNTRDDCGSKTNCNSHETCATCISCYTCPGGDPSTEDGTLCQTNTNCASNNCNQTEQTDCVATISAGAVCCELTRANGCQDSVDNCPQKPSVDVCPATQQATCENYTCVPVETGDNCLASNFCMSINDPCKPIVSVNMCKPSVDICISPNKANQ